MFRILLGLTVGALIMAFSTIPAQAGQKKASSVPEGTVIGTIKSISEDGTVLTVEGPSKKKKKPGVITDVKITKSTKVEYDGIENKDDQKLQVGYGVTIKLDEKDKDTATSVKVSKSVQLPKKQKKIS